MAAMLDGRNNEIFLHEFVLFLPSNMAAMQTLHLSFPDVNKNKGVAETAPVGSVQTFVGSGFVSSSTGPVSK